MTGILRTRLMDALAALFNVLALNLMLLIFSLPIVTLPASIAAATQALERWRRDGEDAVVREFLAAFRAQWATRTALVGVPLAAAALGVIEVRHFVVGAGAANRLALGFGSVALLVTASALGYVFLLAARGPASDTAAGTAADIAAGTAGDGPRAAEFWTLCIRLGIRNILVTGPLFLLEIAGSAALASIDPPLLLLGLPVLALQLMRLTADLGLRRDGRQGGLASRRS